MKELFDKFDEKILLELDKNSRLPSTKIAKRVSLSKERVIYRLKKLNKSGHIKYFQSIINASNTGYYYSWVIIKFQKINANTHETIINYLITKPYVANIRIFEGQFDIAFLNLYKSPLDLRDNLGDFMNLFGEYILEKKVHAVIKSYKFGFNTSTSQRTSMIILNHSIIKKYPLNKIDIKILEIISSNARIKILELAKKLKADPGTIRYHLKNLERQKIIEGYVVALDFEKFKKEYYKINMSLKNYNSITEIISFFNKKNSCFFAYELVGYYDLSIDLHVSDSYELRNMLDEFKEAFIDNYISYDLIHIISEYKINWSPFD